MDWVEVVAGIVRIIVVLDSISDWGETFKIVGTEIKHKDKV